MYPRSIRRFVWDRMRLHLPVPVDGGDIPILFRCDVEQKKHVCIRISIRNWLQILKVAHFHRWWYPHLGMASLLPLKQMEMWRWPWSEAWMVCESQLGTLMDLGVLLNRWRTGEPPRCLGFFSSDVPSGMADMAWYGHCWSRAPTRRSPQSMIFNDSPLHGDSCWWMLSLLTSRLKTKPPKNQPITENPSYILLFNG